MYQGSRLRRALVMVLKKALSTHRPECTSIFDEDWDVLIILDACRYDAFESASRLLRSRGILEARTSCASDTWWYIYENFLANPDISRFKNLIYVSANPTVDASLGNLRKYFYKYLPVWRLAWYDDLATVPPWETAYYALRVYASKPTNKKMIVHFLQPHDPFIGPRYGALSRLILEERRRDTHRIFRILKKSKELASSTDRSIDRDNFLTRMMKNYLKPLIRQGFFSTYPGLGELYSVDELVRAYLENLIVSLPYVDLLLESFAGKLVVTADHGESLGETTGRIVPIRAYGHFGHMYIDSLVKVPWYTVENDINYRESLARTLRIMLKLRSIASRYRRLHEVRATMALPHSLK